MAIDVIMRKRGHPEGARNMVFRFRRAVHTVCCRVLVLATGGAGQLWRETTNPSVATGTDGNGLPSRSGAKHLEFIQFHPTALQSEERGRF